MEKIDEQLNNLSMTEVPLGMHQSIMRKINYHRIKPILFISFVLFMINFLLIAWRIDTKLIDAEFIDMARDFFPIFKFNFSFIATISGTFFDIISPALLFSAILSLTGAIYIGRKINSFQFSILNNKYL